MKHSDKLGNQAKIEAAETGIAFGWEVGSLLTGRAVCIAACEVCEDLVARSELDLPTDIETRKAVQLQQEGRVWEAFRAQAHVACCEHLLDYLAYKGAFQLPTLRVKDYTAELALDTDRELAEATGFAFGPTTDGGFVAGCDRCAFALHVQAKDVPDNEAVARGIMRHHVTPRAFRVNCAHWFRHCKLTGEDIAESKGGSE